MPKTEHMIDWGKTAAEIDADYTRMAEAGARLIAALDALDDGSAEPGFRGWENAHGEPVGNEVQDAREALSALVRPNVKVTGRRRAKPRGNQQRSCWRSG